MAGRPKKRRAEDEDNGNVPTHKMVRAAPPPQQDMYGDVIVRLPPLVLQLKKKPLVNKDAKSETLIAGERLKASKFHANFLKIGTWEYISQYEGDLVAKCYYATHKLVWEVLNSGLKTKIELHWSHITTLKATYLEDGDGILDLVLSRPPLFYKQMDPQLSKHTLWQASADFTGGQASLHRRHILRCPSSLLKKNFEKLIRCDQRLNQLSQEQDVQANYAADQPNVFSLPMNLGSTTSDVQVNYVAQQQNNSNLCDLAVPGPRSSMSMDHLDNCMLEQIAARNLPPQNIEVPSKGFLELSERLLSDTHGPPSVDEEYVMARVDSLCSLLEKDTTSFTIPVPEHNDTIVAARVASLGGRTTYSKGPPIIPRKDSFNDLLENLPGIESSEFLFDILEDSENSG